MIKREEIHVLFGPARLLEVQAISNFFRAGPGSGFLKPSKGTGLLKKASFSKVCCVKMANRGSTGNYIVGGSE